MPENVYNVIRYMAIERRTTIQYSHQGMRLGGTTTPPNPSKTMCFPLVEICKFVENGNEDCTCFFARVILKDPGLAGAIC